MLGVGCTRLRKGVHAPFWVQGTSQESMHTCLFGPGGAMWSGRASRHDEFYFKSLDRLNIYVFSLFLFQEGSSWTSGCVWIPQSVPTDVLCPHRTAGRPIPRPFQQALTSLVTCGRSRDPPGTIRGSPPRDPSNRTNCPDRVCPDNCSPHGGRSCSPVRSRDRSWGRSGGRLRGRDRVRLRKR